MVVPEQDMVVPWPLIIFGWVGLILIGWQMAEAIAKGKMRMRWGWAIRKDENPRRFWSIIVVQLPMLAICTWLAMFAFQRILAN
jgi:hypothetical protein